MSDEKGKRITLKRTRPNPLFEEWLEELHEEAKNKKSKLESMLREALNSLLKYPLPLKSGAECIVLKGFKRKLCVHLDQRLEVYKYNLALKQSKTNGSSISSRSDCSSDKLDVNENVNIEKSNDEVIQSSSQKNSTDSQGSTKSNKTNRAASNSQETVASASENNSQPSSSTSTNINKQSKGRIYKPAYRSGAYAILIALLEHSQTESSVPSLTKEEIIEKAQKHAEESFTRPKPETHYTAWSNISTLVNKKLVKRNRSKTINYQLTKEGEELAKEILNEYKKVPTMNDVIFNDAPSTSHTDVNRNQLTNKATTLSQNTTDNVIELPAGSFDIILLIDKHETGGLYKRNDQTVYNQYPDLKHDYRSLKIGDFTWIARHKVNTNQELVLPYVLERKRMDDLGASIKDGRFHEQKFRLRKCGLKNVFYLVENYGNNKHVGLPYHYLMQALANTRIQDGFKVHFTKSLTNSVRFLAMMTKRLTIRYKDKDLKGRSDEPKDDYLMTFEYFNKTSAKSRPLTVRETFVKLLLQLKGVSVEKALAITEKYSTPMSLIRAYQRCHLREGEYLLANLKYYSFGLTRNVGPAVSKTIYQLFSSYEL